VEQRLPIIIYFGIVTYGKRDTTNSVEADIYIEVIEDGTDDYVIFNANYGALTISPSAPDDVMITAYCNLHTNLCGADWYTNAYTGATNPNLFNNNVILMPVGLTSLGLVDGVNTIINLYTVSYSRESPWSVDTSKIKSDDVARQSFAAMDTTITGIPIWVNYPGMPFIITYDKAPFLTMARSVCYCCVTIMQKIPPMCWITTKKCS
jgi:hypothetical protein